VTPGNFVFKQCYYYPSALASLAPEGDASQMLLHAKLYEVGDIYDVPGLKGLSRQKFVRACAKYSDDDSLATAAEYVFNTSTEDDKGLREVVSRLISEHLELLDGPVIKSLFSWFNGLALDLLNARAKDLGLMNYVKK
jgi:hypothetical protein